MIDLFNLKKYALMCSKYEHSSKVWVQPCELLIQRYTGTLTQALLTEPPNPGGRGQSHTCMTSSCLHNPHEVSGRGDHTSVCVSCPYTLTRPLCAWAVLTPSPARRYHRRISPSPPSAGHTQISTSAEGRRVGVSGENGLNCISVIDLHVSELQKFSLHIFPSVTMFFSGIPHSILAATVRQTESPRTLFLTSVEKPELQTWSSRLFRSVR